MLSPCTLSTILSVFARECCFRLSCSSFSFCSIDKCFAFEATFKNTSSNVVHVIPYEVNPNVGNSWSIFFKSSANRCVASNGKEMVTSVPTSEIKDEFVTTLRTKCKAFRDPSFCNPVKYCAELSPFLLLLSLSRSFASVRVYPLPNLDFKNTGLPTHANDPADIIATRSHNKSASSMKCVVNMIVLPVCARFRMTSHMNLREYGSIPLVGSSRNTIDGSPINAHANDNFLFIPPDKFLLCSSILFKRSTSRNALSIDSSKSVITSLF